MKREYWGSEASEPSPLPAAAQGNHTLGDCASTWEHLNKTTTTTNQHLGVRSMWQFFPVIWILRFSY